MALIELNVSPAIRKAAVSIGNFDGVHRGHQAMVAELRKRAAAVRAPAVVVTFDPHPVRVLRPDVHLPRLTTIDRRRELLRQFGADEVVVLPTDTGLLEMGPADFFEQIIVRQLQAAAMVEGPDFHFGKDRAGQIDVLRNLCHSAGVALRILDPVTDSRQMVSSTRIRRLLDDGQVAAANDLLGHRYRLSGQVVTGAARGRTLGFPTANLQPDDLLIPADGVYAGTVSLEGHDWPTAIHIGPNPTFADAERKVECHLVGFDGDLYGKPFSVDLLRRLRPLVRFQSEGELRTAIRQDVDQCVALVSTGG